MTRLFGMVAVSCVLDPPIRFSSFGVPEFAGPAMSWILVPTDDGGDPKPVPLIETSELHVPLDVADEITGRGTTVFVGVAVAPGVFVATGVSVGVAVAPSGAKALKPLVLQGRRPSAKNVQL